MRWLLRLAVLVAAVVLGQQLWERQRELLAARQDLDLQTATIESTEGALDDLDRAIDQSEARLRDMESQIAATEREYPRGIPQDVYAGYSALVAAHNEAIVAHNQLVARHDELRGEYRTRVDQHNARVAEANSMIARATGCGILPAWLRPQVCDDRE